MHICRKIAETVCGVMDMQEEIPKEFLELPLDGRRTWYDPVEWTLCLLGDEEMVFPVRGDLRMGRML